MKYSLFRVELRRLLRHWLTWLAAGMTALAPLAGDSLFPLTVGDSMTALYLANPMLSGGLTATVCFALMMLVSLERPSKSGIASISDAIVHPMTLCVARMLAVLSAAAMTAVVIGLLYLPYTIWKLNIVFSCSDYALSVLLFLLSGAVMGTVAAAMLWQLTGRADVSLLALLAALILSRGQWFSQYFLFQWSVPLVSTLSDAFGSAIVWRTAFYSRLVWLCLLGGGWLLSLLCVRQYGKNAIGSFACHVRKAHLPALALLLLCCGRLLWVAQPFVDHSPENWTELMNLRPDRMNQALTTEATALELSIDSYLLGRLSGTASYQIKNTSGQPQELYVRLNPGYKVRSMTANGYDIAFEDLQNDMIAARELCCPLPADESIELVIAYSGAPRIWNAQENLLSGSIVSKNRIELSSIHLAPVVGSCAQVTEDARLTLRLSLPNELVPVSSGRTKKIAEHPNGDISWLIENSGTDRLDLFAGDYVQTELSTGSGMPIRFYFSEKYQSRLDQGALSLMQQAVAYCAKHYGPRSFTEEQPFQIVQTSAFLFGGYAKGNISSMGEGYFSDENLQDPDKGPDSAEILAHEIIHQWWGLGAMLSDPVDANWNDEGITVYTTYRLMREIMGEDYAMTHYVNKWQATIQDQQDSFYLRHPEYLDRLPERYANEIRASLDSANWYDGNALMIYRAAQMLGEEELDAIWSKLYTDGGTELPPYITLGDFLAACGLQKGDISRG